MIYTDLLYAKHILSTLQISEILICSSECQATSIPMFFQRRKKTSMKLNILKPWNFLGVIQVRKFLRMKFHYTVNI